eukprot:5823058-Pleurochrysis_carterae.AAC.1
MLCRVTSCPTPDTLGAAQRVLYYLSRHRSVGLRYARSDSLPLAGFSDSDWATRHSTSGCDYVEQQKATYGGALLMRGGDRRGLRGG